MKIDIKIKDVFTGASTQGLIEMIDLWDFLVWEEKLQVLSMARGLAQEAKKQRFAHKVVSKAKGD